MGDAREGDRVGAEERWIDRDQQTGQRQGARQKQEDTGNGGDRRIQSDTVQISEEVLRELLFIFLLAYVCS